MPPGAVVSWTPQQAEPPPYRPIERRARWTLAFLALGVAVDAVALWSGIVERSLLDKAAAGELVDASDANASDRRQAIVGGTQGIVFLITVVLFLAWFYRCYANIEALGAQWPRYGKGWAVGGWFVPILNVWRPKQIANDIWRASDPSLPADVGTGWRGAHVPAFLLVWWLAYQVASSLYNGAFRFNIRASEPSEYLSGNAIYLAADTAGLVSGLLAALVVYRMTRRQTARAAAIGVEPQADQTPFARRRSTWAAASALVAGTAVQAALGVAAWSGALTPSEDAPGTAHALPEGVLVDDDFSTRANDWAAESATGVTMGYRDGEYQIHVTERDSEWQSIFGLGEAFDVLSVETDGTLQRGAADVDAFGVACLATEELRYVGLMFPGGYYLLAKESGGGAVRTLAEDTIPLRLRGRGTRHRIRLDCVREADVTTLALWIDGDRVVSERDRDPLPEFQAFSLVVSSGSGTADVRFDDVLVTELEGS
jgi:Domain of unknown function (DUF4328)